MKDIIRAIEFARKKHDGQKDDNGNDFFTVHVRGVYRLVSQVTDDKKIKIASLLHDTLEDTDTTKEEIEENFGEEVAELVMELTKEGEKDEYGYYFPRLKSREAIMIKFADRLNNLSRMESWDNKRVEHYIKRSVFWKDGKDK